MQSLPGIDGVSKIIGNQLKLFQDDLEFFMLTREVINLSQVEINFITNDHSIK